MKKEETREYLRDLYNNINIIDKSILDFKIAIHNLDKLGYNIEEIEKLLDNEQIEFYKLKTKTNDFIKEKLKN